LIVGAGTIINLFRAGARLLALADGLVGARQHIAFGGDIQPLWKVILVLLLTGGWVLGIVVLILIGL
jgi:hypothetical protein